MLGVGRPGHEQQVGQDRSDQGRLDDLDQTRPQREERDERHGEARRARQRYHDAMVTIGAAPPAWESATLPGWQRVPS
jgi:hypothetical protein